MTSNFSGFSKKTIRFFRDLEKNNDKIWFENNKNLYEEHVTIPAVSFVTELGNKLKSISPAIIADPRRDKSIFRINRDTRFSKNKDPYKTHLGIYFWEGEGKKLENPGFYFHLDSKNIMLASGTYIFQKESLNSYREAVVDEKSGKELTKVIKKISKNSDYKLGWSRYKMSPKAYNSDHPNSDYLLFGGIGFLYEIPHPKELFSAELINYSYKIFKDFSPIHRWLTEFVT